MTVHLTPEGRRLISRVFPGHVAAIVEAASGPAREQLRPERRDGKLWHSYWHALIRARKP